jgi:hypothetical protein
MKIVLVAAIVAVALITAGCLPNTIASVGSVPCTVVQPAAAAAADPPNTFQPYDMVSGTAPVPADPPAATLRNLTVVQHLNRPYLSDSEGHYYDIGRDTHGHIYPAYYDTVTDQDYPLYFDHSRDRYYRVLHWQNRFYMNFIGDRVGLYYRCDQPGDYVGYDPPIYDCPVISDGNFTFTVYSEPAYYIYPNRYYAHWHNDNWFVSVPILIGAYFVLNENQNYGPAWYYGYQSNNPGARWAYRQNDPRVGIMFEQGGRQMTSYVSVTQPEAAMVPRREWAHDAMVYSSHRSPAQTWGNEADQRDRTAMGSAFNRINNQARGGQPQPAGRANVGHTALAGRPQQAGRGEAHTASMQHTNGQEPAHAESARNESRSTVAAGARQRATNAGHRTAASEPRQHEQTQYRNPHAAPAVNRQIQARSMPARQTASRQESRNSGSEQRSENQARQPQALRRQRQVSQQRQQKPRQQRQVSQHRQQAPRQPAQQQRKQDPQQQHKQDPNQST